MGQVKKFSISHTAKTFKGPWDPRDLVEFSDLILRVAKFEAKYGNKLHTHIYDEFFLVLEGNIVINLDNGKIKLNTFDGAVVPAGVRHQPSAQKPALVLMLDKKE